VIRQGNLTSVDQAYTDAHLIIVTPVRTARFFPVGSSLVLNRAAILTGGEPLLTTTIFSWMDESPDKRKSDVERVLGRYTVMAEEKIGNGTVYVLSDPSIFINGMKDPGALYGNRFFLGEIAHTPGPLLIDSFSSRTGRVQGAGEIIHSVRSNDKYQVMIAALLVAGIVIAWNRRII
jgi:hypothetical protein